MAKAKTVSQDVAKAELKVRTGARPFRIADFLFKQQLEFVSDPARFKLALTTRRAGKTTSCAADLIFTAFEEPYLICLYITLSRTNAKKLVWKELKKINDQFSLNIKFNESELSATLTNGSIIYCSGASDKTEIEKFRGLALKKVYIDEAQSFPSYIEELVDEVLSPALMDHMGTLCLIGTPGPIPNGYFYDCCEGTATKPKWPSHFWSFWDNPYIKNPQLVFEQELARRGMKATDPAIQREWAGKWIIDEDSLVYHYSKEINGYDSLPKEKYTYILGVDLGFDDADAIAVLAWNETSLATYVVEEVVTRHQGITELVSQIESLRKRYDVSKIVLDTGGLGKKIGEELSRRYKIAVQPAEKVRKFEYIELMNDALRTGQLKAKHDSRFAEDSYKVEWDKDKSTPDKKVISSRFHSDICEAVLYAWRESYSFTHTPEKPKPGYRTDDWYKEEAERMEQEAEDYFKKQEDDLLNDPFGNW